MIGRAAIIREFPHVRSCFMSRFARILVLVMLFVTPSIAAAELECGYLVGTRQTAIRLTQAGWPFPDILQHSLDHPNYRNITREERELVIRIVQEAYTAPRDSVSTLVLDYCQAEVARKNAGKAGAPAPANSGSPAARQ